MKGLYVGRRRRWSRLAGGAAILTVVIVLAAVGGRALGAWGQDMDFSAFWRLLGVAVDTAPGPEDALGGDGGAGRGDGDLSGSGGGGTAGTGPTHGTAQPVVAADATFTLEVLYEKCNCLVPLQWIARDGQVGLDRTALETELARLRYDIVSFTPDEVELQHRNTTDYCPVHADGVTLRWVDEELVLFAGRGPEALVRPVVLETLGSYSEAQLRGLLGEEMFAGLVEGQSFANRDQAYRLFEGLTD